MASPVAGVWMVDWLNANSQRKYPLHDESTGKDTSGSFELPDDLLVDCILPVHPDPSIDPAKFHLHSVTVFATGVTLGLGYDGVAIGSATVDRTSFTRNTTVVFQCTGDFFDTVAKVVIGSLDSVLSYAGSFEFGLDGGRLCPTVVRPDIRGVNSIFLKNGDELSDPIQDDIILEAGRNAQLILDNTPSDYSRIIFNFIEGAGTVVDCDCKEGAARLPIMTINGIGPNSEGDFVLEDNECQGLNQITNGLQLEDKCAKPCCGCDELNVVTEKLDFMSSQIRTLEDLASRLDSQISFLQLNCLNG
jgi:hypothetical protein